jgi:hypothetical protein
MGPFGVVELERGRDGFKHAVRHPGEVAPLQSDVVLPADARQRGDLLAA